MYGRDVEKKVVIKCSDEDVRFPIEVLNQWDITELEIIGGRFNYFPEDIKILKFLKKLTLVSTEITEIPAELFELKELRYLNLKNNRISKLPKLNRTHLLEHLNLGRNSISTTEINHLLMALAHLNTLDLGHNEIKQFPTSILNLHMLNRLNLEGNRLKDIPSEIKDLKNLRHLSLGQNPFSNEMKEKLTRDFNFDF